MSIDLIKKYVMITEGAEYYAESIDTAEQEDNIDWSSVEIDGVDMEDYPDLCDAYFSYGEHTDGTPLTDEELDRLNDEYRDVAHEMAHDSLHESKSNILEQESIPDIAAIHEEATEAAIAAESAFIAKHGEPMYCGFAWVNIYGIRANSKIGKEISKFCKKDHTGAFSIWNPGKSGTQSMDVKEQGADAYAKVWQAAGFRAYAGSRAD